MKQSLWRHFGGSIDMLGNAIKAWPEEGGYSNKRFYYIAYHTLVFLDYYLSVPPRDFSARLPYTLTPIEKWPVEAVDDVLPDKIYSKTELLGYLKSNRKKCHDFIMGLTEEKLQQPWISGPGNMNMDLTGAEASHYSVLDILFYNMKHVQHHVAQLNLILRQTFNEAPDYMSMAADD